MPGLFIPLYTHQPGFINQALSGLALYPHMLINQASSDLASYISSSTRPHQAQLYTFISSSTRPHQAGLINQVSSTRHHQPGLINQVFSTRLHQLGRQLSSFSPKIEEIFFFKIYRKKSAWGHPPEFVFERVALPRPHNPLPCLNKPFHQV